MVSLRQTSLPRVLLKICAVLLLVGLLGAGYVIYIEPHWLKIERVRITSDRLPAAFDGYTILQMSDFHLSQYNLPDKIHAAVNLALRLKPDLVALTGDFVSSLSAGEAETLSRELSRLSAADGVVAVLGNHDMWTDAYMVSAVLHEANVTVLQNSHVILHRDGSELYVAGVGDVWENQADLPRSLNGVPLDAAVILLAHEPDFADRASLDGRIVLQLSGHTHGGQVRLPGFEPFVTPYLGQVYKIGWYAVDGMQLYVNRGIGVIRPPVRFFCRPEVTLITLVLSVAEH